MAILRSLSAICMEIVMRKMFWKSLIFSLIILFLCLNVIFLSTKTPFRPWIARLTDSEDFLDESEMLPYFDRAVRQDGTTNLVIGDSVCRQMFSGLGGYNPETSILATNAALMMPGQYLLAREYIENHPDITSVYLVMHPMTLTRTFDMEWGYRYAAMTYVETDNLQYLDRETVEAMEEAYGVFFLRRDVVRLIEDSPICRKLGLSYINVSGEPYAQSHPFEIADLYVQKLYDLCQENGAELYLYSSPVSMYYREQVEALSENYEGTWMSSRFPDYLEDIWYYPDEWSEDMSHFSGEYAQRDKLNQIIEQAYGYTRLGQDLKRE